MITTWSMPYLRRGGLPDMDIAEKTGVIERRSGPCVATMRLTQVRISTNIIILRLRVFVCSIKKKKSREPG